MGDYGIFVPEEPGRVEDGSLLYDSRKQHVLVSLVADPPHLDVFEVLGGTQLSAGSGVTRSETIFSIEHKLPYTPECLCYIYVKEETTNDTINALQVGYYHGSAIVVTAGVYEEFIRMRVTPTHFQIEHVLHTFSGGGTNTSTFQHYTFRIKYYILSMDSETSEYAGQFTDY